MDEAARELAELLERAREGSAEAAQRLYDRYSDAVQRVVRRWLQRRLRRHYDSADFVQSVWASFFAFPRQRHFPTPQALIAFLSKVAYNKVVETTRQRLGTLRRDLTREVSLDGLAPDDAPGPTPLAVTPTPSQHAQADECWHRLLAGLPPGHRRALELRREGHSCPEIAKRLGVDPTSIRRLLDRLERRMK